MGDGCSDRSAGGEAENADLVRFEVVVFCVLPNVADCGQAITHGEGNNWSDFLVDISGGHDFAGRIVGFAFDQTVFENESGNPFFIQGAGDIESLAIDGERVESAPGQMMTAAPFAAAGVGGK